MDKNPSKSPGKPVVHPAIQANLDSIDFHPKSSRYVPND